MAADRCVLKPLPRCECSPPAEGKEKKRLGPRREDGPLKDEKSSKREKEWKDFLVH